MDSDRGGHGWTQDIAGGYSARGCVEIGIGSEIGEKLSGVRKGKGISEGRWGERIDGSEEPRGAES